MIKKKKEIQFMEGKNVSLIGFNRLDKSEEEAVRRVMATYIKKIEGRTDYDELRIRLKTHRKSKSFIHEIHSQLLITPGKSLSSKITNKNPYKALAQTMIKLINELIHQEKKKPREKVKRKC